MSTKNCPYCGEMIQSEALKCRHCGEWLETTAASQPEETGTIAERLEAAIRTYATSHLKKYKSIFLLGENLTDTIIGQHKKYAPIQSDEKVLLAVNKIITWLYPFSGEGIVITDRFLYYRLYSPKYIIFPPVVLFKKHPKGIIPLTAIKEITFGSAVKTLDGKDFGVELIINGQIIGLLPFAEFTLGDPTEELKQIFKVFDHE